MKRNWTDGDNQLFQRWENWKNDVMNFHRKSVMETIDLCRLKEALRIYYAYAVLTKRTRNMPKRHSANTNTYTYSSSGYVNNNALYSGTYLFSFHTIT